MHADLQRLLAPNLLANFSERPIEDLRAIRVELSEAEGDISFVRRLTQGRLDIVGHETDRRAAGGDASAVPGADPSSLLFDLPDILGDPQGGGAGRGQAVAVNEPGRVALSLVEILDQVASPPQLSGIESVGNGELADLFDSLREFELELSAIRRQLHDRIDTIQDEIARRYRDGEASVDALLS